MHPTHDSTSMKHQSLVIDTNRMRGSNRIHDAPLDSAITKLDTSTDNDKHEVIASVPHEDVHKDLVKMTPPMHNIDTPVTPPHPDTTTSHNGISSLYKGVPVNIMHNNQPQDSHFTISSEASDLNFPLLQKIYINYKQDEFIAAENKHESAQLALENNKPSLSQVSLVHQALRDGDICNSIPIVDSLKLLYQSIDDVIHIYKVKSFIEYGANSIGASSRASLSYGSYPFYQSIAKNLAELFPYLTSVFMEAPVDKETSGETTSLVNNECKMQSLPSNLYVSNIIPAKNSKLSGNFDCLQVVTDYSSFVNGSYVNTLSYSLIFLLFSPFQVNCRSSMKRLSGTHYAGVTTRSSLVIYRIVIHFFLIGRHRSSCWRPPSLLSATLPTRN